MRGQTILTCQSEHGWEADTVSLMGRSGVQFCLGQLPESEQPFQRILSLQGRQDKQKDCIKLC